MLISCLLLSTLSIVVMTITPICWCKPETYRSSFVMRMAPSCQSSKLIIFFYFSHYRQYAKCCVNCVSSSCQTLLFHTIQHTAIINASRDWLLKTPAPDLKTVESVQDLTPFARDTTVAAEAGSLP